MRPSLQRATAVMLFGPLLLLNASCETAMNNKEALIGAALGGGAGAGIGKAVGGDTGMLIGLGAGLVTGALVGHYVAKLERTRTETTQTVGYRPEQGNVLTISEATAAPPLVRKGEPVKVSLKYTILRPDEEEQATVKETHEVRCNGSVVDTQTQARVFTQGTQRINWDYPLKSDARSGSYEIVTTAQAEEKQSTSIVKFTVQ